MATRIRHRRGTAAQWTTANPVLASGEVGYETDTRQSKVGDGSTPWTSLGYHTDPLASKKSANLSDLTSASTARTNLGLGTAATAASSAFDAAGTAAAAVATEAAARVSADDTKADDAAVVKLTGNQTVAGTKTFSSAPSVPDASFTIAKTTGLQSALDGKQATIPSDTYLLLTGPEQAVTTPITFDGGKPWWDARSLATLQAALTAASAAGGGDVRVAVSIALGSTSITVPNGVDLTCVGKGELSYAGTGVAITFDTQVRANSVVNVRRTSATPGVLEWDTGTDTSSIGVRLLNCSDGTYRVTRSEYFETGVELRGSAAAVDAGTHSNTVYIGRIANNKRNVRFSGVTSGAGIGYANQNTFIGGRIRHDSGAVSYVGTRGVDLSTTGNGNSFLGVNMEGTVTEQVVDVLSVDNSWIGCRSEGNLANSWRFRSTAFRNVVLGGQGLLGPADAKFLDESTLKQNFILGGRGINLASDGSNASITTRALSSNGDASYKGYNISGQVVAKILGGGQFESYLGSDSFPRVKTDVTGGAAGYGGIWFGRGNVAPTNYLGVNAGGNGIASSVNLEVVTAGQGLRVKEGSNAKQGASTLVSGSVVVANTSVTATSRIFLTVQSLGTVTTPKSIAVTARSAGVSFTITSEDATDTSVVAWEIFEPAA